MSVSFLSSVFLACSLAFSPVNKEMLKEPTTHVLTIKIHDGGELLIDGVSVRDTILELSNANVAALTEPGNRLFTVVKPDGDIFYKGDFTLAIQSITIGTMKIELLNGEALLSASTSE